jgi:hypothetical protein
MQQSPGQSGSQVAWPVTWAASTGPATRRYVAGSASSQGRRATGGASWWNATVARMGARSNRIHQAHGPICDGWLSVSRIPSR